MTTLRELLQSVADRGLSTRAMEKQVDDFAAANSVDMSLNRATASLILSGKYKSKPSDSTIRAIAHLAGVPEREAFKAAGKSFPAAPFAEELPEGVDRLSPKRRRVVLDVVRSMIEAEDLEHRAAVATDHTVEADPMSADYLPDGTLNPAHTQFAPTSPEQADRLASRGHADEG